MFAFALDNQRTVEVLFTFYIIAVLTVTLFVRAYGVGARTMLNPLIKYNALGKEFAKNGWKCFLTQKGFFTEIFLNILLFVPLGFLVPIQSEGFRKSWKILLLGLGFSMFIECAQFVLHMGCFDTADLIHNTAGAGIGYFVWWKWMRE